MPCGGAALQTIAKMEWCEGWRLRAYRPARPRKAAFSTTRRSLRQVGVDRAKLLADNLLDLSRS